VGDSQAPAVDHDEGTPGRSHAHGHPGGWLREPPCPDSSEGSDLLASTTEPCQHCEVTVLVLLTRSVTAMENGQAGGIDMNQVVAQYGDQSAVWQAFSQADGQVVADVEANGPAGVIGSIGPLMLAMCRQYGA
jgi:hypothetical protein